MRKIIISYDEEESFAERVGEEVTRDIDNWMDENNILLVNDQLVVIVEVLKK